jgi:hypothetical protein
MTAAVRRRAVPMPEGLKPRYAALVSRHLKSEGICKACSNRHAKRKQS